jgi:predicted DCC family thiol-disulfide oxidoreductase YuxK
VTTAAPVLLYDGACGLCASSVQFILRHERQRDLRFAPLQGAFAADVRRRHPHLTTVDSMVWVESPQQRDERVYVRSTAALRAARYVGGAWALLSAATVVPMVWRDGVYDFIARHRHRLFGNEQCFLPPPEVRARFLE